MKAAVLHEFGIPEYADFPLPSPELGTRVKVLAAGLNHLDVFKAGGQYYTGIPKLPCITGSDGVGLLPDGQRIYFDTTVHPYGSMAEYTIIDPASAIPIDEMLDDATAAILGNTGATAYLALTARAQFLPGESVLILGATSSVGLAAVQIARLLGAGRIIAAGRDSGALARAEALGADVTIDLTYDSANLQEALLEAGPTDVTIDLLWGEPAKAALEVARMDNRHVQIGHRAGASIELSATTLRRAQVNLMGHAVFHYSHEVRAEAYKWLSKHIVSRELSINVSPTPLSEVAQAWKELMSGTRKKFVLLP